MSLTVRYPAIDFNSCFPNWAPHLEFAMKLNAFSITPVNLEPYIIRVYNEAKKQLDPVKDAELLAEVEWFIGQESQHYRQHQKFNKVFETTRYPEVAGINKAYNDKLRDYEKNKSLAFNLTYIEGFEATAGVFYKVWFDKMGKFRFGAKEEALRLYDWHFAEEYEHREVAYKLYMRICARGNLFKRIWYGYFYRIFGCLKIMADGEKNSPFQHLMAVERQSMTPEEVEASKKREKALGKFMFRSTLKGLLVVLSPFYDPKGKEAPEGLQAILAEFEPGGKYAKLKAAA